MKVSDIADEIYIEVGQPSDTSVPAIAFWVRCQVGALNTMLYEDLYVNPDTQEILNTGGAEISPEIVAVLKQMYKVYDLGLQIRRIMDAAKTDGIVKVQDNLGGVSFVRINRNEMAKTYLQFKKDEAEALRTIIDSYRSLTSQPSQVAGDDTTPGYTQPYPYYRPMFTRILGTSPS